MSFLKNYLDNILAKLWAILCSSIFVKNSAVRSLQKHVTIPYYGTVYF